jgi:DNA-binding Xre family transcriptional regulator
MTVKLFVDIDRILKSRAMTLCQLAQLTGIDKGNLSRIRHNKSITFRTLNKLASGLGETNPMNLISVEVERN